MSTLKMLKSKIPLPSQRSAPSLIPLPTKSSAAQSKKLPLNPKEGVISKKPVAAKQILTKPLKVGGKDEKSTKSLPSSKSYNLTKMGQKKPSSKPPDAKNVANINSQPATKIRPTKETKPVPVRQPSKYIAPKLKPVAGKENQSKRASSFKPHTDKKGTLSRDKPKPTNKAAVHSKIIKETNKLIKPSTNTLKENISRGHSVNEEAEKVATVASIKETNLIIKSAVDDSEFKDSRFFKQLILSHRELSPGIIKMCSEAKFSSSGVNANLQLPQQKFSLHFQSADEFVEEVKRTSSKYFRLNGKLVPHSPYALKLKEMSAEDFVDEVRRNSSRYLHRRKLFTSPCLTPKKAIFQSMPPEIVSDKENLNVNLVDEVRRLSEFRKQASQNVDSFMANRRWTCNVPSKPTIANMNTAEIAAELRRLSEMRRDSGAQHLIKKVNFLGHYNSVEKLNPHKKVLKEIQSLTDKKKERMKKKVTFLIPTPGSPELATTIEAKIQAKLSDISEGSSKSCTPELVLDNSKVKRNSLSEGVTKNADDTSVFTTPELNLPTYQLNFESSPKVLNGTRPFDLLGKGNKSTNYSSDNQIVPLEVAENISENNTEQCMQNSNVNLNNLTSDFLSKFSSLEINHNDRCTVQGVSQTDLPSFENYLTSMESNSYSEFSKLKSTDCLFPSVRGLALPSSYPVNETGKFCVNTRENIYTPHPVALNSKSNLLPSVSPLFLNQNFSSLNSYAPICTPMVLKNLSQSSEVNLSDVRQRLDFNEKPNLGMERRESQIIIQSIPTIQKMNDFLCDQECSIFSSQCAEEETFCRNLLNPIATILSYGDEMHFIPVNSP